MSTGEPLNLMSDQERISPYNINTTSRRYKMRIKEIINKWLIDDPIPNSLNLHQKYCIADNMENYYRDLGVKGLTIKKT